MEASCRRPDHLPVKFQIIVVAVSGGQRDVQRVAGAASLAGFTQRASTGVKRELMSRDEQHRVVIVEHILCAVAMMHIIIHDHHPLQMMDFLRVAGGDGDVPQVAEAHRPVWDGMMPRWSGDCQRVIGLPTQHRVDRL